MYPAPFQYHRATSVQDAIALMERLGEAAKVLAGGHSLLPAMRLRFSQPAHVIDIGRIAGLSGITDRGNIVAIGATTCHAEVAASAVIKAKAAAVSEAAGWIGDVQVRNRGTIGGSVAYADPGADLPAALIASGAQIVARGKGGERVIEAGDFFTGPFSTALKAGELVTEVRIPAAAAGSGAAYEQYPDPASGYAVCGVAAVVTIAGGKVTSARVAITGVSGKPQRLVATEKALTGADAGTVARAAGAVAHEGLELYDDARGTAEYRAQLARVYTERAVARAIAAAG